MELECSRCHRKFQSSSEGMTVCPDCLKEEFGTAPPLVIDDKNDPIVKAAKASSRRQAARAEQWYEGYQHGGAFTASSKLRFGLGMFLFLICLFLFMLSSGDFYGVEFRLIPESAKRPVSLLFCWVAAALVFTATRRHRAFVVLMTLFLLLAGWFMPDAWRALEEAKPSPPPEPEIAADAKDEGDAIPAARRKRVLTEGDLTIFREKRHESPATVHYAIYVDNRDTEVRQAMRDALARLLEAGSCVAYTRAQGSLFVVERAAGGTRNIARLLSRFGSAYYAIPAEGIYEVSFDAEKANVVCRFSDEVLATPANPSFVSANLAELRCVLDPQRVRLASIALAKANVEVLREDIRDTLVSVLRDPWISVPETYSSLIDALVVYAPHGDKQAVDVVRKYFLACRSSHLSPSQSAMSMLIRESPEEMVSPVVELWCSDPVAWNGMLEQLGTLSQDKLLDVLKSTDSLQIQGAILKHLEKHGTPEAIPAVEPFADHSDSLISRAAKATLRALNMQF